MNSLVLLLLLFMIRENKNKSLLPPMNKELTLDIDIKQTREKVKLLKKIGPYFPEAYLNSLNRAIGITEKVVKFYEVYEHMRISEFNYVEKTIPVENSKERIKYIANAIEKEFSKDQIKAMGKTVDMILKIDKLNRMMNMMSLIMENPVDLNDKEGLLRIMDQFSQGKSEEEKKRIKDMMKMLDIIKALDSSKKPNEKNNNS
jgi:hypothetical protein